MRVVIFCDMEGISGINHWDQVQAGGYLYEEGRTLYTEEVNAVIRGARDGGAGHITVIDTHGAGSREVCCKFNSLRPDQIDPEAHHLVTHQRYLDYMEILEGGFDRALFVGIHAKENTPKGVLAHTISSSVWSDVWINGTAVGEIGIMSAMAGAYNIPMAMIVGDEAACVEGKALLGDHVSTVAVKRGLSRFSAIHIPPERVRVLLKHRTREAMMEEQTPEPFVPKSPVHIRFQIKSIDQIDSLFRKRPGLSIDDNALTVETEAASFLEAWWNVYPW